MSGICGWNGTSTTREQADTTVQGMAGQLHLGEPKLNLHAAYSGFACAASGDPGLPSLHDDDNVCVTCYGDPWLRSGASDRHRPNKQAAVFIAASYLEKGIDCLRSLHGIFVVAIHDKRSQQTLIAVDRAGTLPLAYHVTGNGLIYASTASSIAAHADAHSDIDAQGIFNFLYFHMVPSPGSIYTGQHKLLPGQYGVYSHGEWRTDFYWHMDYADEYSANLDELEEEFHSLLRRSIRDASRHNTVGAFLSGGTDSSTVSGVLAEISDNPAQTYSIGFNAEGFDETEYARIVSTKFATNHHEYYVTPDDVVDAIPHIAASYDEPFGNASAVPTYYCAMRARDNGIDTLLAGDGGDELFGGNSRYATQKAFEIYDNIPNILRKGLIEPLSHLPGLDKLPATRKIQSYIRQAKIPLPDRLETYNFLHQTSPREIFTSDFLAHIDADRPIGIIREVYQRGDTDSYINRMMHMDLKNTLADNDFRKVCKMCELGGVNVRFPLIDEDMMEFSARIPPSLQVRGYKLRYFFKRVGLPFGKWMVSHAPLREMANESLNSLQLRGYIRPDYITKLKELHQGPHASYYGVMIWVMMMLEQWLQSRDI